MPGWVRLEAVETRRRVGSRVGSVEGCRQADPDRWRKADSRPSPAPGCRPRSHQPLRGTHSHRRSLVRVRRPVDRSDRPLRHEIGLRRSCQALPAGCSRRVLPHCRAGRQSWPVCARARRRVMRVGLAPPTAPVHAARAALRRTPPKGRTTSLQGRSARARGGRTEHDASWFEANRPPRRRQGGEPGSAPRSSNLAPALPS